MLCARKQSYMKIFRYPVLKFHQTPTRMIIENPGLYNKHNEFQKKDAFEILQKYKEKINWKPNASIVDLGCGDGLVTHTVLKQHIPKNFKELIGLDVGKNLIEYAEAKYSDDRTKFFVVDLGKKLPEEFKGRFDHAFSCHALHFIKDQVQVFTNVHELLKDGGNFAAIMFRDNPYMTAFRQLAIEDKWKEYMKNSIEEIMPRIFLGENYQEDFKTMMRNIGFKDCSMIECPSTFVHEKSRLRAMAESANFFKIDNSQLHVEFLDDFMDRILKLDSIESVSGNYDKLRSHYTLVLIFGNK